MLQTDEVLQIIISRRRAATIDNSFYRGYSLQETKIDFCSKRATKIDRNHMTPVIFLDLSTYLFDLCDPLRIIWFLCY